MAKAQPIRALANFVENRLVSGSVGSDERSGLREKKIAFLNAQLLPGSVFDNPQFIDNLICEQSFRPQYLALKHAGFSVSPELVLTPSRQENSKENEIGACLVLAGKYRAVNEIMIERAHCLTRKGGMIVVAGAKNVGIGSLRKRLSQTSDIMESMSKFHSVVFVLKSKATVGEKSDMKLPGNVNIKNQKYDTGHGLFSAQAIDQGSALLAQHFDNRLSGKFTDLGAGWGYLSAELAKRSVNITGLDLYEADWNGIIACRQNLEDIAENIDTGFYWHDVTSEPISGRYDGVILNPPFHLGSETSLELGLAFIRTAAEILRTNGRMLMVANRHLAYERTIDRHFSSFRLLEENAGYKIIFARI